MPCHAMHPIQDLFFESFSYELQLDMHSYLHKKFYSCKKWVLHSSSSAPRPTTSSAGGARDQAPTSSGSWQWLLVHGWPGQRDPQPRGPSPRIFPSKINSRKSNFLIFLRKILETPLEIQTFITFQPQLQIQWFFHQNFQDHSLFHSTHSYNTWLLHYIDWLIVFASH
jgi:hypothetical protein